MAEKVELLQWLLALPFRIAWKRLFFEEEVVGMDRFRSTLLSDRRFQFFTNRIQSNLYIYNNFLRNYFFIFCMHSYSISIILTKFSYMNVSTLNTAEKLETSLHSHSNKNIEYKKKMNKSHSIRMTLKNHFL